MVRKEDGVNSRTLALMFVILPACTPAQQPSSAAEACEVALDRLGDLDVQTGNAIIDSGACDGVDSVLECEAYAEHRARFDAMAATLQACKVGDP